MVRALLWLLVAPLTGCAQPPFAALEYHPVPRRQAATLVVDAEGRSEWFWFRVAPGARSITLVARGAPDALYALAALVDAEGSDRVQLDPSVPPAAAMQHQFIDEQVALMPGALVQTVRLGEFTHVHPYAPGQSLPAGVWALQVACDRPGGAVEVSVENAPDDRARTLHLNLFTVSDDPAAPAVGGVMPAVAAILAQADLTLVVDEQRRLTMTAFSKIDEFFGALPGPQSELSALARQGRAQVTSDGLDVFVVDSFAAPQVRGTSLGLPGGPDPTSYYFGVVARNEPDPPLRARVLAHEIAHFLALQHVENVSPSGRVYPDAYDDTAAGQGNLMDGGDGTGLSTAQAFALGRSALLRRE